jgi:hypothetical protein
LRVGQFITAKEVTDVIKEVDPLRDQMDDKMNAAVLELNELLTNRVRQLCEEFKENDIGVSGTVMTIAKVALEKAATMVPKKYYFLVHAALQIVQLAENAVVNKNECVRLAARVARINLILLDLMITNDATNPVLQSTAALETAFANAVALLQSFQVRNDSSRRELSWFERVKATYLKYSPTTATEFAKIHEEFTSILAEAHLSVSLQNLPQAPSLEDIRAMVRAEVAHINEEIQGLKKDEEDKNEGNDMSAVQEHLQKLLDSSGFRDLPQQQKLNPSHVIIHKDVELGRGAISVVYAGTLHGLTAVAVKVIKVMHKDAFESVVRKVQRANHSRHRNVAHVFGIVMLENYTVGVVMERLGVSLENTNVPNDFHADEVHARYHRRHGAHAQRRPCGALRPQPR